MGFNSAFKGLKNRGKAAKHHKGICRNCLLDKPTTLEPPKSANAIGAWVEQKPFCEAGKDKNLLSLPGIKPSFLRHPAHSPVTTSPTTLNTNWENT